MEGLEHFGNFVDLSGLYIIIVQFTGEFLLYLYEHNVSIAFRRG